MRIAVTGGSGFIGTRLVDELLRLGHEVVIIDKVASAVHAGRSRVADLRDAAAVEAALAGTELVYHLAAEHRDDVTPVSLYDEVNVTGTRNLVAACRAHGIERIVFTSSVAVYGMNLNDSPETTAATPFNDYGRTKHLAELELREWAAQAPGRSLAMVRPAVIFGEGNRGNVYNLMRQIRSGHFVMVGDGLNRKSMGYVGNIAAFLAFLGREPKPGVETYNYADKPDMAMTDLVALARRTMARGDGPALRIPLWLGLAGGACLDVVSRVTGKSLPISAVRVRKFCSSTTVSVERARATGFEPPFTLSEGLERFLAHEFAPGKRD